MNTISNALSGKRQRTSTNDGESYKEAQKNTLERENEDLKIENKELKKNVEELIKNQQIFNEQLTKVQETLMLILANQEKEKGTLRNIETINSMHTEKIELQLKKQEKQNAQLKNTIKQQQAQP